VAGTVQIVCINNSGRHCTNCGLWTVGFMFKF